MKKKKKLKRKYKYKKKFFRNIRKEKYDLINYKFLNCNSLYATERPILTLSSSVEKEMDFSLRDSTRTRKIDKIKKTKKAKKTLEENIKLFSIYYKKPNLILSSIESNALAKKPKPILLTKKLKRIFSKKKYKWLTLWRYQKSFKKRVFIRFNTFVSFFIYDLLSFEHTYCLDRREEKENGKRFYYIIYATLTNNNINIIITNPDGTIKGWSTSGLKKFKGSRKRTVSALKAVARNILNRVHRWRKFALKNVKIVFRGNPNRIRLNGVLQVFKSGGYRNWWKIISIIDMSTIPYNGCKISKKRI